ncbi:MAG: acyl-CoA thioesterase II [Myxococcales bacterium]
MDAEARLQELLELLELEKIEEHIFRGRSQDLGFGNIFGGQVLGQALSAALQTVPPDRPTHSAHGYFLRPGDPALPIVYTVDAIRDGTSFTTRRVVAVQKGRAIFSMAASFQIVEGGFDHQDEAPVVDGPEGLVSDLEIARAHADRIPETVRAKLTCDRPIEIRAVDPINPLAPDKRAPDRHSWFRAMGRMPDSPAAHQCLLAYASDFGLLGTSLYPHGHTFFERKMQVASIDHAIWFHRPVRADDWLLYAMHSPSASGGRGLNFGRIFTRDGRHVASVAQEGLIRYRG